MAKGRLNTDDTLKSIIGNSTESQPIETSPQDDTKTEVVDTIIDVQGSDEDQSTDVPTAKTKQDEAVKEKLIQTSFYITEKQRKALKIRSALGDMPEDKDQSSIVRAALDAYLADTLQSL